MKKTVAFLLALMLCIGCALAEEESFAGTWVSERADPAEALPEGIHYELIFTEDGQMSFSANESFHYAASESNITLTADEGSSAASLASLLGEIADYTYSFLSPDRLLMTSEKRQYSYLFERKSGTDGFEGEWEIFKNLDSEEMEKYLSDPEGYESSAASEHTVDLGMTYSLKFLPDGTGFRILTFITANYTASDGMLAYTEFLDDGTENAAATLTLEYRFEDGFLVLVDTETHEEDGEAVTETTLIYFKRAS